MAKKCILIWMLSILFCHFAQGQFFFTGYGGGSIHWPTTFHLQLREFHYTVEDVHFASRSFEFPLYYGISIGKENAISRFAIELIHDKAFVRSHRFVRVRESNHALIPPGTRVPFEVLLSRFSVSHGCNFVLLKYAHRFFQWGKRFSGYSGIGAGVLISHVESQHLQEKKAQYEMHFPAGMVDGIFQWKMAEPMSLVGGWKITGGRISRAHVVGGNVSF